MSQIEHVRDTQLAVAVVSADSPGNAKALVERFRRDVHNAAIESCAVLADSSIRVTGTQIRKLLK